MIFHPQPNGMFSSMEFRKWLFMVHFKTSHRKIYFCFVQSVFFFRLVWQHSRQCWGWKAFITRADVTSAKLICHETFVYVVWWVRVVTNESFYCYNQVSLCALKERKEDFCPKKRKNSLKINTKQLAWLASIYLVILHIPHAFAKNWDARITLRSRSTPDFCL